MTKIFSAGVGIGRASNTFAGRYSSQTREQIKTVVDELNRRLRAIQDLTPQALENAMTPTFAKAVAYTPVKTGRLRASGYMLTKEGPKGPVVEMGFGKGANPPYAAYVHERTDIPHTAPTRAKFLQSAIEEDIDLIPKRIAEELRKILKGGKGRRRK